MNMDNAATATSYAKTITEDELYSVAAEKVRMVERFAQLLREQADIAESLRELADEAKSKDLDPAALRKAARFRIDQKARGKYIDGHKTLLDYMEATGDPLEE